MECIHRGSVIGLARELAQCAQGSWTETGYRVEDVHHLHHATDIRFGVIDATYLLEVLDWGYVGVRRVRMRETWLIRMW